MIKKDTAILLFSRTAAAEAAAKPLALSKQSAESVALCMINHVKKLANQSKLPVFFFSEKQQRGSCFGERFANAFDDVFGLGFEKVIAIGNDCLTVSTAEILAAANALTTTPSVLGGTSDGGAYLIGFQRKAFQKNAFENINWQTNSVFTALIEFVEKQNFRTLFLSQKSDIDRISDWKHTLNLVSFSLKKIFLRLLYFLLPVPSAKDVSPINSNFLNAAIALRAPPCFCV